MAKIKSWNSPNSNVVRSLKTVSPITAQAASMQTVRSKTWNQFCTIPVEPRYFILTAFDWGRLVLNKQCTSCHYMVPGFVMGTAK